MLIDHFKKQIVCISVPKTGSTSLHYALLKSIGMKFETKNKNAQIYHMNASDISKIMGPYKFRSYYSFSVVRNPYDRVVSLYHDFCHQRGVIKAKDFEDFVINFLTKNKWKNDIHFLPQTYFLFEGEILVVKEFFKYEDGLEVIYKKICEQFDLEINDIGHARKSDRDSWQVYYTNPEVIEIVREQYKKDFELLGYSLTIDS